MTVQEKALMDERYREVGRKREKINNPVKAEDKAIETALKVMDIFGYPWKGSRISQIKMVNNGGFLNFLVGEGNKFTEPTYSSELMLAVSRANGYLEEDERQRMVDVLGLYCEVQGDIISFK